MTCLRIYLFVSTFLLFIPLHNGSADELQQSAPRITIGAILPLSGEASNFGAIARRGIEMALDSLSADDRARVSVVFEDDALSNVRSATAARKLLSIDKVDALLTWSSGTGITVASMAESKRIPHISIASDPAVSANQRFSLPTGQSPVTKRNSSWRT
jgi:ABC-type branched-subunit amino acid transport system substrate-binding protein